MKFINQFSAFTRQALLVENLEVPRIGFRIAMYNKSLQSNFNEVFFLSQKVGNFSRE